MSRFSDDGTSTIREAGDRREAYAHLDQGVRRGAEPGEKRIVTRRHLDPSRSSRKLSGGALAFCGLTRRSPRRSEHAWPSTQIFHPGRGVRGVAAPTAEDLTAVP